MGIDPSSLDNERSRHEQMANQPSRMRDNGASVATEHPTVADPSPGTAVFSADGKEIGRVKDVHGGYMELDVSNESDFWLSMAYLVSNDGDRAYLGIPQAELGEHRLHQPGLEMADRGLTRTGTRDETNTQALHIRELMERELVEQRGTIDTGLKRDGSFR